ncbi:MAG: aminoacyl-histidine dipeptidase [Sphaerochaetaceae bacterium]|nr:aminoacyl-histidine dipeptidase [Sphaerochaetaceae bacterium]MDD3941088.1 aminoacyl-histidine dipeptidase [Sphaerochaetaceae bacterium]MDX9938863.1 aminoacyl-histidine dipeptidase [Sphaerochaetaceae bacterium]
MASSDPSRQAIEGLAPERLWNFFLDLSRIPRESGNEKQVRTYLVNFAKQHGFAYHVDTVGNLIIKAPATKGMEHVPSLALQGHMDMVCVKDEGVDHDFATDPLTLVREGDWLKAKGTTLGADNGIAIALMLDLLTDETARHGPIEAIITVSEETGLEGAFGLDASKIDSRKMLNLDSEEEGVFYIGCAGGVETNASIPLERTPLQNGEILCEATVDGLHGGHSGGDIHLQRANSIVSLARFLRAAADEMELRLVSINGGTKRNVIPSVCKAVVAIRPAKLGRIMEIAAATELVLKKEYAHAESGLRLSCNPSRIQATDACTVHQSLSVINALLLAPHGVERMSQTIAGMVETSSNLASIRTTDSSFNIVTSHRSSVITSRDMVARKAVLAFETAGAKCKMENPYPSWTPDPSSPLAGFCAEAWETHMGGKAKITAIHAGLECGIINSLVEGMDSVSLGPTLHGVHSTKERVSISSTEKIAKFLRALCPTIA